jgi:NAD(P)-dependent dehydrogenase (short-subunit alcohol dehydrogenase family)
MTTVGVATGAGRGMGKACAIALGDMVDALLLVDLDAEAAAAMAKELTGRRALVEPFAADVVDACQFRLMARTATFKPIVPNGPGDSQPEERLSRRRSAPGRPPSGWRRRAPRARPPAGFLTSGFDAAFAAKLTAKEL